jgi:hypothetical protein
VRGNCDERSREALLNADFTRTESTNATTTPRFHRLAGHFPGQRRRLGRLGPFGRLGGSVGHRRAASALARGRSEVRGPKGPRRPRRRRPKPKAGHRARAAAQTPSRHPIPNPAAHPAQARQPVRTPSGRRSDQAPEPQGLLRPPLPPSLISAPARTAGAHRPGARPGADGARCQAGPAGAGDGAVSRGPRPRRRPIPRRPSPPRHRPGR